MTTDTLRSPGRLIRPSVIVGIGAVLLYILVGFGLQIGSGIPYVDWFKSSQNAWRTAVIPLAAVSVLLLFFTLSTRWRYLWNDPFRLKTTTVMKVAMVYWWAVIALRLIGVKWGEVPLDLLLAILASGILVGFAEETLFRGIFLRCMREGGRNEAAAAVLTAVVFGLFHLPNVLFGVPLAGGLLQTVLAALSGLVLYAFRRQFGVIWPAMIAHGAWDISVFLTGSYQLPWLSDATYAILGLSVIMGIAVLVSILRTDRQTVTLPVTTG